MKEHNKGCLEFQKRNSDNFRGLYFGCSCNEYADNQNDPTNPTYYQKGGVNSFDFTMEVIKDLPACEAVCVKDVLKYVIRYKQKNGLEDLKKARWYLDKLIEMLDLKGGKDEN
jgi:hypothetical protein